MSSGLLCDGQDEEDGGAAVRSSSEDEGGRHRVWEQALQPKRAARQFTESKAAKPTPPILRKGIYQS